MLPPRVCCLITPSQASKEFEYKAGGMMAKILIVDDDDSLRELLEEICAEEGHCVAVACNGREALNILKREGGWVVLLDMMMPEVTGPEVIRQLEDNPKLAKGNKIIALSAGWGGRHKATKPVSPLVVAYVSKPFDVDALLALISATSKN
jgi:CheY-like chemotaxis protein